VVAAVLVTLERAPDSPSALAFAAGFTAAAGVAVWIALAVRFVARLRAGGARTR
jgi:hypothetical protein